jgi:hypothetical protein
VIRMTSSDTFRNVLLDEVDQALPVGFPRESDGSADRRAKLSDEREQARSAFRGPRPTRSSLFALVVSAARAQTAARI